MLLPWAIPVREGETRCDAGPRQLRGEMVASALQGGLGVLHDDRDDNLLADRLIEEQHLACASIG